MPSEPTPEDVREALERAVERGWVRRLPGGQYEITDAGRAAHDRLDSLFTTPGLESR